MEILALLVSLSKPLVDVGIFDLAQLVSIAGLAFSRAKLDLM